MIPLYAPPVVPWLSTASSVVFGVDGNNGKAMITQLKYGNFFFPPAIDFKFQVEPVYGEDRIVPKWYKHTFYIETTITPQISPGVDTSGTTTTDLNLSQLRRALSVPGLTLWIYAKGIGQNQRADITSPTSAPSTSGSPNVDVATARNQDPLVKANGFGSPNDEGTLSFVVEPGMDLNFGPKPNVLILEPISSSRAYRLVWSVEVCLPICCVDYQLGSGPHFCMTPSTFQSAIKQSALTEFTYGVTWHIDSEGYTNRTITGTAEIAGRLDQNLTTDPPTFKTKVFDRIVVATMLTNTFPYLPGFHRDVHFDLSRDGRRIDFRMTDEEIPSENPLFSGVLKGSAKAVLRNTAESAPAMSVWDYSINGTFTVAPGIRKWQAYLAFLTVVRSRLNALINLGANRVLLDRKGNELAARNMFIPTEHVYEEDIFGRTCDFAFSYMVFADLTSVLQDTNMFRPIQENGTWQAHADSLPSFVKDGRGSIDSQLNQERQVWNLCADNTMERADLTPFKPTGFLPPQPIFNPSCPPVESSWLEYKNWFEFVESSSAIQMTPTYEVPEQYYTDGDADYYKNNQQYPPSVSGSALQQAHTLGASNNAYPTIQGLGVGKYLIRMTGYAVRLCAQVVAPNLQYVQTTSGAKRPYRVYSRVVLDKVIKTYGKVRVIMSMWDNWYTIDKPPNTGVNFIKSLTTDADGEYYFSNGNFSRLDPEADYRQNMP